MQLRECFKHFEYVEAIGQRVPHKFNVERKEARKTVSQPGSASNAARRVFVQISCIMNFWPSGSF